MRFRDFFRLVFGLSGQSVPVELESVRIQKDSDGGTHGSWWQVALESSNNNSVISVSSANSAPNCLHKDRG